jgi:hypothetical protein
VDNPIDEERAARIRQARQVLAGTEIRAPEEPLGFADRFSVGGSTELRYFVALAALVLIAVVVWAAWGMGPASPVIFVLALALLAGWFLL